MMHVPFLNLKSQNDPIPKVPNPLGNSFKRHCSWADYVMIPVSPGKNTDAKGEAFPEAQNTPIPMKFKAVTLDSKLAPDDGAAPSADDLHYPGKLFLKKSNKCKRAGH
jgi:hypothetical protein